MATKTTSQESTSQWTLERDWPGNTPVHRSSGKKSTSEATPVKPGHGEVAKYESYGEWGIGGPPIA